LASLARAGSPLPIGDAVPARIVSTSPSITETLFALGLGDRVVGVSRYCRYPEAASRLPNVGTFLQPDAEVIARLRPDLAIVHAGPHQAARQLAALGIRVVTVEPRSLESVFATIGEIGRAAGVHDRADALVREIRGRLDRIRERAASRSPRKVLLIVGRRPGVLADMIGVGRESYLNDVIMLAGGTNNHDVPGLPAYPRISMETVLRVSPDVIIDGGNMGDTPEQREAVGAATLKLWKAQPLAAARAGRVHTVVSDAFVVPGPRVVEVAETMAAWLHGVTGR
jgi:iron complex transport system substrate-binding protein